MPYRFNFSRLTAELLRKENTTPKEVIEVFNGDPYKTVWDSLPQYNEFGVYYYLIGFTSSKRFLQIVISYNDDEIFFLDVKTAGLDEIKHDFFKLK